MRDVGVWVGIAVGALMASSLSGLGAGVFWTAGALAGVVCDRKPWKRGRRLDWRVIDGKVCDGSERPIGFSVSGPSVPR